MPLWIVEYMAIRVYLIVYVLANVFIILPAIFPLYLLVIIQIQSMKLSLLHDNLITVIPGVAKQHEVLFEGTLLIKITTISMLFAFKQYCTGVLIKNVVLIEEIQYVQIRHTYIYMYVSMLRWVIPCDINVLSF